MKLYTIKKEYINYIKTYDSRVPNIDYNGRLKPFIGIIFNSQSCYNYFCPISSFKTKYSSMNDTIDFVKIIDYDKRILCALNINNMLPVPKNEVIEIKQDTLGEMRVFNSRQSEQSYWLFLKKELSIINLHEEKIKVNAEKIIYIQRMNPNHPLNKRCLNFTLLDEKCKEYEITKAMKQFPSEEQNKQIIDRYLSVKENKVTYEFDHKIYLIKSNHNGLSLPELNNLYGDSFFDVEFDKYAQIMYRNIDYITSCIKTKTVEFTVSEEVYIHAYNQDCLESINTKELDSFDNILENEIF